MKVPSTRRSGTNASTPTAKKTSDCGCAGYGYQVACRDAEALNGALLVRRDDGSEEIKFRKDRYLTTVEIEGRGAP